MERSPKLQESYAIDINNKGSVAGGVSNDADEDPVYAAVWRRDGVLASVAPEPLHLSYGVPINDRDWTLRDALALWIGDSGPFMLPSPTFDGFSEFRALSLNNKGQIVGLAWDASGNSHLVLWTVHDR